VVGMTAVSVNWTFSKELHNQMTAPMGAGSASDPRSHTRRLRTAAGSFLDRESAPQRTPPRGRMAGALGISSTRHKGQQA